MSVSLIRWMTAMAAVLALGACGTQMQVVNTDAKTGYFPTGEKVLKGTTLTSEKVDLKRYGEIILVPRNDFDKGMVQKLGIAKEVIDIEQLQTRVVQANLTDKVPSVSDRIGISNAARYYKPFLWVRYDFGGQVRGKEAKLIVTEADTQKDVFVASIPLDYVWAGVNDQNARYPLYNALLDWVKSNKAQ